MRSCAARSFLFDLQDTATLISDPHVTPLGLRFPFLIVEAKAGANWREPLPGSKSSCSRQFNCSSDSPKTIGTKICPKFWKGKFTMILRPARCHLRACPTSHQTWSFFHYEKPDSRTAGPPPETRRRWFLHESHWDVENNCGRRLSEPFTPPLGNFEMGKRGLQKKYCWRSSDLPGLVTTWLDSLNSEIKIYISAKVLFTLTEMSILLKNEAIRSYTAYRPRYNFHLPPWSPNSKYYGDPPIPNCI